LSLPHTVQTGSGAQPASYSIDSGSPQRATRSECEADHSPISSKEDRNGKDIPPLPHLSSRPRVQFSTGREFSVFLLHKLNLFGVPGPLKESYRAGVIVRYENNITVFTE
jgi:hypothetical protein